LVDFGRCVKAIADALYRIDKLKMFEEHPRVASRIYGREILGADAERLVEDLRRVVEFCPRNIVGFGAIEEALRVAEEELSLGRNPLEAALRGASYGGGGLNNVRQRLLDILYEVGNELERT